MTDRKILGERLKKIRNDKRLTQRQVADATGISKESIGGYENGKEGAPFERIYTLAKYYQVSLDELVGHDPVAADPAAQNGASPGPHAPAALRPGALVVDRDMVEDVLNCRRYQDVLKHRKPGGLVFAYQIPERYWLPDSAEWEATRSRLVNHVESLRKDGENEA